jgi:hypothetical protein
MNYHNQTQLDNTNDNDEREDQSTLKKWQVVFATSSFFTSGVAFMSLIYIWKFCDC